MKTRTGLFAIPLCCIVGSGLANERMDIGKREYMNSCAVCHGADGRAQTQALDILKAAPPDLRLLAKKNGGVFPLARVYEVIDGRTNIKAHGTRDMPIWGFRYSTEAAPAYDDFAYRPEVFVRARILGVVDYLYRLQEK